jgi:Domain of unknown function (DUF4132)
MARWSPLPDSVAEIIRLRLDDPLPAAREALARETAPVRREAAISLVQRHTDSMFTPFQDIDPTCRGLSTDDLGKPGDPWLVSAGLLDALPTLPDWTIPELRRLLKPLGNAYSVYERAVPSIRAVFRQLDGVDPELIAQLEFELTAFVGALSRPNLPIDPAFLTAATARLPERRPIDAAISVIESCDDWGVKCTLALRRADVDPKVARDTIAVAKQAGGSGKRWQERLTALLESDVPTTVATVGSVLGTMSTTIAAITWPQGWMPFLPWAGNEKLAAGALAAYGWWTARTAEPESRAEAVQLCEQLAWWGARWDSIRPISGPVARGAAVALGELGGDAAIVALHRLHERFDKRPGLGKHLDAALARSLAGADRSLIQILTSSGPWFGLDAEGFRRWTTDRGSVSLALDPPSVVVTEHATVSRDAGTEPGTTTHDEARAEAEAIRRTAEQEIGVLSRRFDTALRDCTTFTPDEFTEIAIDHPVSGAVARRLIWRFDKGPETTTGVPRHDGTIDSLDGNTVLPTFTVARLWHPIHAAADEVQAWQAWALERQLRQPVRQVDREVLRLAENPSIEGLVTFRQTEGILRSRGWRVHRLDRWDGGAAGPAFREEPSTGFRVTVHLTGDLSTTDGPMRCRLGGPDITFGRLEAGDERIAVFVSEALRDLALVSAKSRPSPSDSTASG